ncbi:MAG: hypothetical protein L0Y42_07335 [Phycisphaerales bacterium]|nr:hypothetical protein [Phycisphaerales bacterium]
MTFALLIAGCGKDSGTTGSGQASNSSKSPPAGATHTDTATGHGGKVIELGTTTIGPFSVRASRDEGEIKVGGDAPIDVWLTGGDITKVTAVRFWIGTARGDDFVKAKADIEIPSKPNHWHTHAEVPTPIPAGNKLWVEIEIGGQKHTGSFDLKA